MVGVEFNGKGGSLSKQATLSKQMIEIWHSVLEPDHSFARTSALVVIVAFLHSIPFFIPQRWLQTSKDSAPKTESVRVRITHASPISETLPQPASESKPDRDLSQKPIPAPQPRKKILTTTEKPENTGNPPIHIPIPKAQPEKTPSAPPQPKRKGALMDDQISPLLPAGKDDFIAHQRHVGEVIGAGAIAGDLDVPDVVNEKDPNEPITRTEYTFAGYFDNLSRRFVEAWGGVRTLPPQSRFEGKIGEFIEYDIVINRDGSLRKIVNISAKREPYRDFAAVDELVIGVFKVMFPFQPVPARIRNDPLVIRKRIQFVGFKYTLY